MMTLMTVRHVWKVPMRNGILIALLFWTAAGLLLVVQVGSDYVFGSALGRRLRAIKESEAFASTTRGKNRACSAAESPRALEPCGRTPCRPEEKAGGNVQSNSKVYGSVQ